MIKLLLLLVALVYSQSIKDGVYTYTVSWENIKSAELTVGVITKLEGYQLSISLQTLPWLKPFYNLRYEAEILVSKNLLKTNAVAYKKDRKGEENITYLKNGKNLEIIRNIKKRNKQENTVRILNNILDPFSPAIMAMLEEWDKGVQHKFKVTNGKTDYEITLTCSDVIKQGSITEYKIQPSIWSSNKSQVKKFRSAEINLVEDGEHRYIKGITSKVFIGKVFTKLKDFKPGSIVVANLN